MILQTRGFGIGADDLEQPIALHLLKINAPAGGVAQQLGAGFLIGKQNRPLFVGAGVLHEFAHQQRLAGAGGAGRQDDRILEEAAATHLVEPRHPGAHAHIGTALREPHRPQRKDADAVGPHGEGELPLHVGGAAQLEDFHRAAPALPFEHIAQDHHVVGDELLDAIAGNRAVFIDALGGHHRGHTDLLEPGNQPEDLATHHRHGVVLLEHRRDRIDRHAARLVFADGVVDPLDQPGEVKTTGHILAFRIGRGIENEELVLLHHLLQVPAKAGGVAQDIEGGFLEGHEDPRLVKLANTVVEKIQRKDGFTGARSAADQGGATDRQATVTDVIKALNSGGQLLHRGEQILGAGILHGTGGLKGNLGRTRSGGSKTTVHIGSPSA